MDQADQLVVINRARQVIGAKQTRSATEFINGPCLILNIIRTIIRAG